ncbi:hypothetical protein VIGAN_05253300, partial [Vigna angularis var. angularis]
NLMTSCSCTLHIHNSICLLTLAETNYVQTQNANRPLMFFFLSSTPFLHVSTPFTSLPKFTSPFLKQTKFSSSSLREKHIKVWFHFHSTRNNSTPPRRRFHK